MMDDLNNISIDNVKKLVPRFLIKKVCASLRKFTISLIIKIKTKKIHRVLEFNQSQ